ncbi:MAG: UpxY family transcription antiterminator [Bacteroidota bacterium]|nr:UpxY family transcription antiterminator [Bacteroidota bacterium]
MEIPYHWYAVYTRSRCEKKLASQLEEKKIETYVPMRKTLKQWSDRKKKVEEVLIPSYVFVKVNSVNYYDVLNTPGAVKYIWFCGKPAAIPDSQILDMKRIAGCGEEVDCIPSDLLCGSRVCIAYGPLRGLTGELITLSGHKKVMIRIDSIGKAITVTINPALLEKIKCGWTSPPVPLS